MKQLIYLFIFLFLLQSCKQKTTNLETKNLLLPQVTITHPVLGDIKEYEKINGQIIFLNKTTVSSPITGYVTLVNAKIGDKISKGQLLYKIQTKESIALQKAKVSLKSSIGIVAVYASVTGYVNSQSIPDSGVFVNEGNSMITIIKNSDLAVQVNAPFSLSALIQTKKSIEVELPNKEKKTAFFYKAIPTVDAISQTQQILFKLKKFTPLPENLNVLIKIPILERSKTILINKEAVLANETQDEFWVMKVTENNVALKINIKKGLENNKDVEILSPKLKLTDKIIVKGAYGLPDSTQVKIN
mgnify:FL=1|tara:strand:- start:366 stop:1268 length:903 start_codon:yes stop_codon:yes gene_type:complete